MKFSPTNGNNSRTRKLNAEQAAGLKTNTPQGKEEKPTHTGSESPQKPTTPSEEENTGKPEALVAQIEEFRESLNSLCPQLRGENPYRKVNMTVENVRKIAQDSWVAGCMAGIALQNLE